MRKIWKVTPGILPISSFFPAKLAGFSKTDELSFRLRSVHFASHSLHLLNLTFSTFTALSPEPIDLLKVLG